MKRSEIITIFRFFNDFKLNKFSKNVRKSILSIHLASYKIAKEYDEAVQELQKKTFEGKDEQVQELMELRNEYRAADDKRKTEIEKTIVTDYKEILELERDLNQAIEDLLNETIDITFTKMKSDEFVEDCAKADVEITPATLIQLEPVFE